MWDTLNNFLGSTDFTNIILLGIFWNLTIVAKKLLNK